MKFRRENNIIFDEELYNKEYVYKDRIDAGAYLAQICKTVLDKVDIVYAIPRGGVPIGYKVASILNAEFDLIICRKLLIPWNREAGFGAVDPSGNIYIDKEFASMLGLSEKDIRKAIEEQLEEIKNRNKVLRGGRDYPDLTGKSVLLTDDGIAGGYTMETAIKFVKFKNVSKVYVAVPTGSLNSVIRLSKIVDLIICPNIRSGAVFAVADAYKYWRDLTDEDILQYIKNIQNKI